jgi:hypothetical protein
MLVSIRFFTRAADLADQDGVRSTSKKIGSEVIGPSGASISQSDIVGNATEGVYPVTSAS